MGTNTQDDNIADNNEDDEDAYNLLNGFALLDELKAVMRNPNSTRAEYDAVLAKVERRFKNKKKEP
jgi:hypothetical protein